MKAKSDLIRMLPDLKGLAQRLEEEPETIIPPGMGIELPKPTGGLEGLEMPMGAAPPSPLAETWLSAATRAARKLADHGPGAELTPEEGRSLEAIVLLQGRPPLLIMGGHFATPPTEWAVLESHRSAIEALFPSVGRIELTGHPSYEWVGTGFLVADSVLMTNRHVAEVFCQMVQYRRWVFKPGMTARVDYVEELGAPKPAEFTLTRVIGVHETHDMSLFRVARTSGSGAKRPAPLAVASKYPGAEEGRQVFTIGYPAWDGYRNDPTEMMRIFSNIFSVKRLQPGEIKDMAAPPGGFTHDCSTLGGNSGSCVIDLETKQVVGLHYGGKYLTGNSAIALWKLTDDPLLKKAKVNFV